MVRYDETDIAGRYDEARALPKETLDLWMGAMATVIPASRIEAVIDVGCGTGRFSAALHETFSARVIGVDPSHKMLAEAAPKAGNGTEFRWGSAEDMPVETGTACLLFLSMAYHHVEDKPAAVREFHRVLRPSGYVCVRTSTVDLLGFAPYLLFFPEAREAGKQQLPRRSDLVQTFANGGFPLIHPEVVNQVFACDWGEYYRKISRRALSDLASISDDAFRRGLERLRRAADDGGQDRPVIEPIDLFVFQREAPHGNP